MKAFLWSLKKELYNICRDKRAFVALFLPLIVFPLVFFCMGIQINKTEDDLKENIYVYSNIQNDLEKRANIDSTLFSQIKLTYIESDAPMDDLKSDKIYLIINFDNENGEPLSYPLNIDIKYNSNSNISIAASNLVTAQLNSVNLQMANEVLISQNVDPMSLNKINVDSEDVSVNTLFVLMAPTLIAMLLISGCSVVAIDAFAGEKERGNLERVLATQAGRTSIFMGKLVAVFAIGLLSAVISLMAYYLSMIISPDLMESLGGSKTAVFSTEIIFQVVSAIISYALFISSLLLVVSILSKSVKEAQSYISLITILPGIIGLVVMYIPTGNQPIAYMAIPIYNAVIGFKMILSDAMNTTYLFVSCGSMLIYSFVCAVLCRYMLTQEKRIVQ